MKAAFYESDITPPLGAYMAGEHYPIFAHDIHDKIFAKSLVIEQDGEYAVIIAVDVCEFPNGLYEKATERIEAYTGIKPERVSITATHAHCGAPVTDSEYIGCYSDKIYTDIFNRLVADSAILAYKRLADASASFSAIETDVGNSRCWLYDDGIYKTGPADLKHAICPIAEIDHELTCLFFERDGKKIGAVINYPCHQDSVYGDPNVPGEGLGEFAGHSGDMASVISKHLKEEYGSDFVSLFLIGPSGDVALRGPFPLGKPPRRGHIEFGTALAEFTKKAAESLIPISGKLSVISEDVICKKRKLSREQFHAEMKKCLGDTPEEMKLFAVNLLSAYYFCDREDTKLMRIKIISIGNFALYVYPGEIFSVYGLNTKQNSPFKYNMVAENSNCLGGYLPVPEAFAENSNLYEAKLSYCSFAVPETADLLYEKMMNLAKEIKK